MLWQAIDEGLNNLRSVIALALSNGARVVVIRPPLPDRVRAAFPTLAGFEPQPMAVLADHNVTFYDFSQAIPASRYYFDTDNLNRAGVQRFLDEALAAVLQGEGRDL